MYFKKYLLFYLKFVLAAMILAGSIWSAMIFFNSPQKLILSERITAANQYLKNAQNSGIIKINKNLSEMPLPKVEDATKRKELFIAALLPLILRENEEIKAQRAQAAKLSKNSNKFGELLESYGLKQGTSREKLLEHIDIVPPSLALAQGALESGWGRSRFALEGNAFFGEREYNLDAPGIAPLKAETSKPIFLVKSFSNAGKSVRSYMKTLNTHNAYADLRQHRARLRKKTALITGVALAPMLLKYSEMRSTYVRRLLATINASSLGAYDTLKLQF